LRRWLSGEQQQREHWALKDVSFDIRRGDRLGIIGNNGAGKTTLLMILAGILSPTEGAVEIRGEIRSPFLGLGTALQPELSVEDNIRLCGALLGLPRAEMDARLEEIIAFGELEPYRHARLLELSSGYKMRVAYSTAFHADSDIVLIDESMAVGDAHFRSKCLEVFSRFQEQGKTIIITSHSMEAVREICDRCVFLTEGHVAYEGAAETATRMHEKEAERYDPA
jgi:ABC-type polysaccharide/polyol phosphate transport system ATPase subunit